MPPAHLSPSATPPARRNPTFSGREEIASECAGGTGIRTIARKLSRSPSTISREISCNSATRGGDFDDRALTAQWHADRAARRPKPSKLACNSALHDDVQDRRPERQTGCGVGGSCPHIEAIGKVARQGTHPGRARQCQARGLFASNCCTALQSRHEGKIRAADLDREMQKAGHHSRHAKTDCHGQRTASGPEKMDAKSSLTNTDTR